MLSDMMDASKIASKNTAFISYVRNNDRMFNDTIQASPRKWQSSNGIAARCVSTLRDALRYIDEMHNM